MIAALEGWKFDGPKGAMEIRAEDHALLQPMFQAKLVDANGTLTPELITTVDPPTPHRRPRRSSDRVHRIRRARRRRRRARRCR